MTLNLIWTTYLRPLIQYLTLVVKRMKDYLNFFFPQDPILMSNVLTFYLRMLQIMTFCDLRFAGAALHLWSICDNPGNVLVVI